MVATAATRASEGAAAAQVARGLVDCRELFAAHLGRVERRFGGYGLGIVDLPELGDEPIVDAQVRIGAVVYWCREVEQAGVLPFCEALAEAVVDGSFVLAAGRSVQRLYQFWREREHSFTAPERAALYERVLGPVDGHEGFDVWFALLVDTLVDIGRMPRDRNPSAERARLARLAIDVGRLLSDRSVGITAFASRDIVARMEQALDLLRDEELARSLGGGAPWAIIERHAPVLLRRRPAISAATTRAANGMVILRWIADGAADLDRAAAAVDRNHRIVHAAESWRAAAGGS